MNEDLPNPLQDGSPPEWASTWGEDRQGAYVGFEVCGVQQVLRWIPAGTFKMGSPDTEEGRSENEGPQHDVTLSKGFWLGDTPVTQGLWRAVMDDNPSEFVHELRPVEQVDFAMVEAFLSKTETLIPGLSLHLPTEAQWEYACRAGTAEATYEVDLKIEGERNALSLDEIAWHRGNSGKGYELAEGFDTSIWKEVQNKNSKAGTRPVKLRRRNPWGLYDMLGNVYEWCQDGIDGTWKPDPYTDAPVSDPSPPAGERPIRVVRGGSWFDRARNVRAACRNAYLRDNRYHDLGFRVARGRAPEGTA